MNREIRGSISFARPIGADGPGVLAQLVTDGQDVPGRQATLAVEPECRLRVGHAPPVPVDVGEDL